MAFMYKALKSVMTAITIMAMDAIPSVRLKLDTIAIGMPMSLPLHKNAITSNRLGSVFEGLKNMQKETHLSLICPYQLQIRQF